MMSNGSKEPEARQATNAPHPALEIGRPTGEAASGNGAAHTVLAKDYLAQLYRKYEIVKMVSYLEGCRNLKVAVVGEAIIDDYRYCEAIGKSSKEPTLVVRQISGEQFAGGTLAIANHVSNFCDRVSVITFLGDQNSHEDLIESRLNKNIERVFLRRRNSPTIVKRRFIESYFMSKLFEVYEMRDGPLPAEDNRALCATLAARLTAFDVVIVADFGHGMISPEAIDILCTNARFLAVNAQSNAGNLGYHTISRYPRADYISIAENEMRLEMRDRVSDLKPMVVDVAGRLHTPCMSITRGKYGCLCYCRGQGLFEIPAFADHVVDRVGAGDAYLSVTSLCVAQRAPMDMVGFIGNVVGALAVATVGHRRSIGPFDVIEEIEALRRMHLDEVHVAESPAEGEESLR
jgi:bifunctional ADP-heptose synthase (sugar kinase/adenylyltransferase)